MLNFPFLQFFLLLLFQTIPDSIPNFFLSMCKNEGFVHSVSMETGERETVYVFQKLSAYMLWILITKPTCEPSLLPTPNTITFILFYTCVCVA